LVVFPLCPNAQWLQLAGCLVDQPATIHKVYLPTSVSPLHVNDLR
jgi:hypothetical protein